MVTEKRFTFADGFKIVAIKDNGKIMNSKQVCNKLNDLEEARSYYQENFLTMKTERNQLKKENEQLKQQLFETSKELLWATSDEVDRTLHYEDEVEELRKEIFE